MEDTNYRLKHYVYCVQHWHMLMINIARDLFISLSRVESLFHNKFNTKIKSDSKIRFDAQIKSYPKITCKFHAKIKSDPKIRFQSKSACIQSFELIESI